MDGHLFVLFILLIVLIIVLALRNENSIVLIALIVIEPDSSLKFPPINCSETTIQRLIVVDKSDNITPCPANCSLLRATKVAREEIRLYSLKHKYDALLIMETGDILPGGAISFAWNSEADVVLFPFHNRSLVILQQEKQLVMIDPKVFRGEGDSVRVLGGQGILFIKKNSFNCKFKEMTMIMEQKYTLTGPEIGFFKNLELSRKKIYASTRLSVR